MRHIFSEGEFYHIYNRGTDKREVFSCPEDFDRFLQSLVEFNVKDPIGSIFENSFRGPQRKRSSKSDRLVNIIAYCLNPNHYHLLLEPVTEWGVEKFMQRLGTGYTKYFNNKYKRNGVLFQGKYKAIHVGTNEYLLQVSAYINLNHKVHQLGSRTSKSSMDEYLGRAKTQICTPEAVLGQFRNSSEYAAFAHDSVKGTLARRGLLDPAILLE